MGLLRIHVVTKPSAETEERKDWERESRHRQTHTPKRKLQF